MIKKLSLTSVILLTSLFGATVAHAQYYGGLTIAAQRDASRQLLAGRATSFTSLGADINAPVTFRTGLGLGLQLSGEPAIGIKLGYAFNPYFAVESRYQSATLASTAQVLFGADTINATQHVQAVGLDLVGNVALMKKLSLQGRAGLRNEPTLFSSASHSGASINTANTTAGVMGLSLNYNVNSSLGLRFEVERSHKLFNDRFAKDADNAVSFGLSWRF